MKRHINEHFEILTEILINMPAKFRDFAGLIYYSQFWHATTCHVMFQLEYPQKTTLQYWFLQKEKTLISLHMQTR